MIAARPSLALVALAASCGGTVEHVTLIPTAPDSGDDVTFDADDVERLVSGSAPPPPDPDGSPSDNQDPSWPFNSCASCGSSHTGHAAR